MMLVTGATGNVGAETVRRLHGEGLAVRAFVRDAARAAEVIGGAAELVVGDLSDREAVRRAIAGAERVLLSTGDGPDKADQERAVIDAAAAEGVELLVKVSTLGAEVGSEAPMLDWHGQGERHLRHSAVPWAILQSSFYMTNLLAAAPTVVGLGRLFAPAGGGKIAMIDPGDTAAVAAVLLAGPADPGRVHVLTGPAPLTYDDVAEALTAALGRPVAFVDVPPEEARRAMEQDGLPPWLARHLDEVFALIRQGRLDRATDTVRALTGREPRTLAAFLADHVAAFME